MTSVAHKVLIVDDHPMTRAGLRLLLEGYPDLQVIGEADSGEEAIAFCSANAPDIVLMDVKLPGVDGVKPVQDIRGAHPRVQVIIITSDREPGSFERAIQAGAAGYLLKSMPGEQVVERIRTAYRGHAVLAPEAVDDLVQITRERASHNEVLSAREREVLSLLAQGLTNEQIAERLTVTEATAKYHVGRIFSKLGAANRVEAAAAAWQRNLLS